MDKIEHIGIAVRDIRASNELFSKLLNTKPYKMEEVESEGVITSFFKVGDTKIELLQATNPESAIAKFIEKRGEGIHHIAFGVSNAQNEIDRLLSGGFEMLNKLPKEGADNKLIAFAHPKSVNGVLVEVCQEKNEPKQRLSVNLNLSA